MNYHLQHGPRKIQAARELTLETLETRRALTTTTQVMHVFGSDNDVPASMSQLTRGEDSMSVRIDASELVPGEAVTLWWVIFNSPEFCEGECNGPDLSDPAVQAGLFYGGGEVVGEDGTLTIMSTREEGDASGVDDAHADFPGAQFGLIDAASAEVHAVLRSHGAASEDPVMKDVQLGTFNGGCNPECGNQQAAVHQPPEVTFDNQVMHLFGSDTEVASMSRLTRDEDSMSVRIDASELVPGEAVTLWWVIFNSPEFCEGECNGPDLSDPAVQAGLFYGGGEVVGEDGTLTIMSTREEGDASGVDDAHADFPGAQFGLIDAASAEVHAVLRSHGAASEDPVMKDVQLGTFNGGCNPECGNQQAAVHLPPEVTFDNQVMHLFGGDTEVASMSRLTRGEDSMSVRIDASELVPNDAVTLWWVIFNNPEFCEGECNGPDLSDPAVQAGLFYGGGEVVGEDGTLTIISTREEGDASGVDDAHADFPGAQLGLIDAASAEVHAVLRTHGAASEDPVMKDVQLGTFNGGCNPDCGNQQAAVHQPPSFGDFDDSGVVNADDIDLLHAALLEQEPDLQFDLNRDGTVGERDVEHLVENLLSTTFGDTNLDGRTDFDDFLTLAANFGERGGWSTGDFDGDGVVGFNDFLLLSVSSSVA